jgi:hypothetical protein
MRLVLAALMIGWWLPPPDATWHVQLTNLVDLTVNATVFDVDLFETPPETVAALHKAGRKAVCHFSAGTWDDLIPDGPAFPTALLGDAVPGSLAGRWLDVRQIDALAPILGARLDQCRSKGFDAVDAEDVDTYTRATGFPLTAADQLRFNRWLAQAAHARGLAIGLRNDLDQAVPLAGDFDFAIVDRCGARAQCAGAAPFRAAGKGVFEVPPTPLS